MTSIIEYDDANDMVITKRPTMELGWHLQNAEGVRPRRWCLMQMYIVDRVNTKTKQAMTPTTEWRAVPLFVPPDDIIDFSKAHAGFVPHELHVEGDMK